MNRTVGFDFSVGAFQVQGNKAQIDIYANNDNSWIRITVSYFITARNDFFLGTFAVLSYQLVATAANRYNYVHPIQDFSAQNKVVTSIAMISGFRTIASNIPRIRVRSAKINTATGDMTIDVQIQIGSPLENIHFVYIWWIKSASIKFSLFNPKAGSSAAYQFEGLNQITNNKQVFTGLAFAGSGVKGAINC